MKICLGIRVLLAQLIAATTAIANLDQFANPGNDLDYFSDYILLGAAERDYSGCSGASLGDIDGDDLDDFIIGAYAVDTAGTNSGAAYLWLGSSIAAFPATRYGIETELSHRGADWTFSDRDTNSFAGYAVSSAGDVDGDGKQDILIGAYGSDIPTNDAGITFLFFSSNVLANTTGVYRLRNADCAFTGEGMSNYSGMTVATAGDVDGDGKDDLLIGAPYYWSNSSLRVTGRSYLLLGSSIVARTSNRMSLTNANKIFYGKTDDNCGYSLAGAGDVDGDGLSDILIGAPNNNDRATYAGKACLFTGSALSTNTTTLLHITNATFTFYSTNIYEGVGYTLAMNGDVDGDGLSDVLIGEVQNGSTHTGAAYIVFGSNILISTTNQMDLANANIIITGHTNEYAGNAVCFAGDIDNDGGDDVLIGAYNYDMAAGRAYLFYSQNLLTNSFPTICDTNADCIFAGTSGHIGNFVAPAGDVDGDSIADMLIGASFGTDLDFGAYNGKTYLILGRDYTDPTVTCDHTTECDTGYAVNPTPVATYSTYIYDSIYDTEHFTFFLDPTDTGVTTIDDTSWQVFQDTLECAYRYFICELGMLSPLSTDKLQIYVGNIGAAASYSGYITFPSQYLQDYSSDKYYVPAHEFFHLIQNEYFNNRYDAFKEATAVLAEQMISSNSLYCSLNGSGRAYALDAPSSFDGAYDLNVFWRYTFEQLLGSTAYTDINDVYGTYLIALMGDLDVAASTSTVPNIVKPFIDRQVTGSSYTTNYIGMLENYITMQYAFRYTTQEQYTLIHRDEFDFATTLTWSSTNMISTNKTLFFSNTNTVYDPLIGRTGFCYYLNGEYHNIRIATNVSKIVFQNKLVDKNVHFQFITRALDNTIDVYYPLQTNRAEEITLRTSPTNIAESVFVAYTANFFPYLTGTGSFFNVTLRGKN